MREEPNNKDFGTKEKEVEKTKTTVSKKEKKNQYHPPMAASMMLELRETEQLDFETEHELTRKANSIDLLITKPDGVMVKSGLGAIFKKVNLIEYKSPDDSLGKRIYHRTSAYSDLYIFQANEEYLREDMTLTFIREGKPIKLMNYLREQGFEITEYEQGIYHVKRKWHSDMQIIVTRLLGRQYKWITKLTGRLEREDMEETIRDISKLQTVQDKLNAEALFDFVVQLNKTKNWFKEVTGMGEFREWLREMGYYTEEEKDSAIAELDMENKELKGQLQSQEEQLQSKEEQLKNKAEQLESEKKENSLLRQEIEKLKQQLLKSTAVL